MQAFRELYIITPAEVASGDQSSRFGQVHFCKADRVVALEQVDPLFFSDVMRDADLVASLPRYRVHLSSAVIYVEPGNYPWGQRRATERAYG